MSATSDPSGTSASPATSLSPEALTRLMPFAVTLGVNIQTATAEEVVGTLAWAPELCTAGGALHGGALMALADSLGGVCAFLNMPPGASTSTIESKTNFFRGVRSGVVSAISRPVHAGRSTVVVQTELRGDDSRLVALVIQTQAVLQASGAD